MGQMTPSIDHVKYFIWRKPGAGARRRGGELVEMGWGGEGCKINKESKKKKGKRKNRKEKAKKCMEEVLMQLTCPSRWSSKPCLPDVPVRMFCKLKLLCRIPIRPVNLAKIALNKWTEVYLYSLPPSLYFIDR